MEFKFPLPSQDHEIDQFQSISEIRIALNRIIKQSHESFKYKTKLVNNTYIYCKCTFRSCPAFIRLFKENSYYKIKKIERTHNHSVHLKRSRNRVIEKYISQLPPSLSIGKAKLMTCSDLKITQTQFYYFFRKIKCFKGTFESLIEDLNQKDFDIRYRVREQNSHLPYYSLFISKEMKSQFLLHSEFVAIDCTYGLVKEKWSETTNFKICSFVGLSSSKKVLPFGLAILAQQTKETYYDIISQFIKSMGKPPILLLSDESIAIIGAVRQLISQKVIEAHGLDKFHILKNIRKRLIHKPHLKYFHNLINCANSDLYELELEKAYENLENEERPILKNFVQADSYYSFCKLPLVLFPGGSTDSYLQKVNDLIKKSLPTQQNYVTVVSRVIELFHHLIEKAQNSSLDISHAEDYYDWRELKLIKYSLDSKLFQSLLFQASKMINLEIVHEQQKLVVVSDLKKGFEYKLYQTNDNDVYLCNCQAHFRMGYPCCHQLKYIHRQGIPLQGYIHKKWIIKTGLREMKTRQPRGKNTRTNRQK